MICIHIQLFCFHFYFQFDFLTTDFFVFVCFLSVGAPCDGIINRLVSSSVYQIHRIVYVNIGKDG